MTAQVVEALVHAAIKFAILVPGFVLALAALMSWIERRQSAMIQDRVGPNRASIGGVRAWGLFHIIADTLKFALKENIVPRGSNPLLFRLAPFMAMAPALIVFAVMPVGPTNRWVVSNLDVGILFIFAIGSLSVYGATIAGWSSNNNFSLLGALRVSAQMISYEVSLALNLVGVFMVFGSINLQTIIEGQGALLGGVLPKWGIVVQPVAFFLFLAASIAETKRTPFDAPEGEPELVSGYFTEYSGLALATWFLTEFAAVIMVAMMATAVFFGGWQIPWLPPTPALVATWWFQIACVMAFFAKTLFFVWVQMQLRWTLLRMRYDQIMTMGWKYILPISLANVLVTGLFLLLTR
ncbi:MAG: NADH-quinone oxidoreductase subunit H [Myxococcales bacterium]|nr:NADH-quinone oxidoreductase subunit H [Myxococcales bacterium]